MRTEPTATWCPKLRRVVFEGDVPRPIYDLIGRYEREHPDYRGGFAFRWGTTGVRRAA